MVAFLDGLFFSEILADNAGNGAFDTDGDGGSNKADEFVEIQNSTGSTIDLSNYSLWSAQRGELYDFTTGASVAAGETATVIGEYSGTPPPGSNYYDVGLPNNNNNQGLLEDGEGSFRWDTLYLVNEVTGEYIALEYGDGHPGTANVTVPDFFAGTSVTGVLVGSETTLSDAPNGTVITRDANGDLVEDTTPDPDNPGPVCFVLGTLIATAKGQRRIEDLSPGDLIETRDHGAQPLRWIGASHQSGADLIAAPHLRPIHIAKGALGPDVPSRDLRVSPQHRMLIHSRIAERMFGPGGVLVPAVKLLPLPGVTRSGAQAITYLHLLFDRHEIVFAEGCESESLYLGEMAQDRLGSDAMAEIEALFPGLPDQIPARDLQKGHRLRRLVERHSRNPNRALNEAA